MKAIVLDTETRVEFVEERDEETNKLKKHVDNSPHNPDNYLVIVEWQCIEVNENGSNVVHGGLHSNDRHTVNSSGVSVFKHNDYSGADDPKTLQEALDWADTVVAHNAKYDIEWLLEAGFRLPKNYYCTYIGEYILSRGTNKELSLEATALRRNTSHKKAHLIDEYWNDSIGFEAIPLPIVKEYLSADVQSCAEVFLQQLKDWTSEDSKSLASIVTLMNEMMDFIVEIQRNGINIDLEILDEIGAEYEAEREQIIKDLKRIAEEVLGDTPFNLNSGADISRIVFSREVKDRDEYKRTFNIGTDINGKKLYAPRMTPRQFSEHVLRLTRVVKKTKAEHCFTCSGKGYVRKTKKTGEPYKKDNICKACKGKGFLYIPTEEIAGLKMQPLGVANVSIHGFSVEKELLPLLIDQAERKGNTLAVEFLTKKARLNAVNTYLNSFVVGIKRWVRADGLLHPSFNQCVTKTGRLSSSNPNFQNQPKGKKFPVRKAIRSRFKGGCIMEADYSGLEFVVAGELSRDEQIITDILNKKDVHGQTASIVLQRTTDDEGAIINWKKAPWKQYRDGNKPHTFAPLYGATGADQPPHIKKYYEEFFNIYRGHKKWQQVQMDNVLKYGKIRTPSGREYAFPGTRRLKSGETTNATRIKNYPVQGFATGDIVPLACIRMLRKFRKLGLKSLLILTIHDSIIADVYPGEEKTVYECFNWAMCGAVDEIKERWNYEMALPLNIEVSMGPSLGELEECKFA